MDEKELIKYFKTLGLEINTSTKARGHQGFFLKNRIDISKDISPERVVPTLLHEFAHYIHHKIEPDVNRTGGSFSVIFGEDNPVFEEELIKVTNFVDKNSLCNSLYEHKSKIKNRIKCYEQVIKSEYPKFLRSKKFKEFNKYIKKSEARYLLKYDRVRLITGFWRKQYKIISVESIEKDFPDMPQSFAAYIRLMSCLRKQKRISGKINRLQRYYKKPTELFARLVEGLYLDREWVGTLAPYTTKKFFECLNNGFYKDLEMVIKSSLISKN